MCEGKRNMFFSVLFQGFFVVNVTSSGNICRESCDVEFVKIGCFNDKRVKAISYLNYQPFKC